MKRVIWFAVFVTGLLLLAYPFVSIMRNPLPAGQIIVASGGAGGLYNELAQTYRTELARFGVNLVLRPDIDGFNTLKEMVVEQDSGVMAGFVKGGFVGGLQGRLATEDDNQWHEKDVAVLRSVGRLFVEPLWVFTRKADTLQSLRELGGKKIFVGSKVSGARKVVSHLLAANGVTKANATLIETDLDKSAAPLLSSEIDVAFLLLPPESPVVQALLRNPGLRLMNFSAEADAYVNRFPYLTKLVLNEGSVEFAPRIPEQDTTLIATSAALVVRKDLHPTLVELLTYAVFRNPKSGFDKTGEPILFYRPGAYPSAADSEFETAPDARNVQTTKDLPVLLRALGPTFAKMGLPFAFAAFVSEHGSQVLLALIPLLSVALPLMRIAPAAYNWTIRRRLLIWYRRLKTVERTVSDASSLQQIDMARTELDDIDRGVEGIRVPLAFSSQLYDLHLHVNVVRQRLNQRTTALGSAKAA